MPSQPLVPSALPIRDKPAFIAALRAEFVLDWQGLHGAAHWARVARTGTLLCRLEGGNARVVCLFALLHDARRQDDDHDPHHGARAAELVREIADRFLLLNAGELARLIDACEGHSEGRLSRDPTVAACWDADRLDLGRVGIVPSPRRMSLSCARSPDIMRWADAQALSWARRAET